MRSLPRFSRGTSIIAALVFAAILGAVALGLNTLQSNSASTAALPAQAEVAAGLEPANSTGSTGSGGTGTTAGGSSSNSQSAQSQPSCNQAIQQAIKNGNGNSGPVTKTYTLPAGGTASQAASQVDTSSCIGAVLEPQYKAPDTNTSHYQCVWDAGTLTLNAAANQNSATTLTWNGKPAPGATTGQCNVMICPSSGAQCSPAAAFGSGALTSSSANSQTGTTGSQVVTQDVAPSIGQGCTAATNGTVTCPDLNSSAIQSALSQEGYNYNCVDQNGDAVCTPSSSSGVSVQGNGGSTGTFSQDCSGSPTEGGFACLTATPQQAQSELQQAGYGNYVCSPSASGDGYDCVPPSTTAPPGGCPAGQSGNPCAPTPAAPTAPAAPAAPAANSAPPAISSASPLSSLLTGLARGLTPCTTQTTGTTYVQQQVMNSNGTVSTVLVPSTTAGGAPCGTTPLTAAQAPYGVGTNGVACSAPPAQPACSSGQVAEPIYGTGNGCVTNYQCVLNGTATGSTIPTQGPAPTAQISCSPQIADVGESVAISYSCGNATGSSGGGFSTGNQTSGSASSTIAAPPSGTNTANFGLTCTNNQGANGAQQSASSQCSVQINQPAIDLVADPQSVPSGGTASIGWVTAGMQSCVVSSPDDANFTQENANQTNVNGVAQTDPITQNTTFTLTCQTLGGETQTASTVVGSSSGAATSTDSTDDVTVSSTADGQTVNHGDTDTITWTDPNAASDSSESAAIWLIDLQSEEATALIADGQPVSGSYQWQIPAVGSTCTTTSYAPCASDLLDGGSYGLEVALYTPQNAYIGPPASAPANAVDPTYSDYGYTANPFTIGQ